MSIQYSDALKQVKHDNPRHIGLKMDMTTIFGFISLIGPFFIMFMMFTLSLFNSNFKGFCIFDWSGNHVWIYKYSK